MRIDAAAALRELPFPAVVRRDVPVAYEPVSGRQDGIDTVR